MVIISLAIPVQLIVPFFMPITLQSNSITLFGLWVVNNIVFPFNKNTHITVLNSNKNNSRYNKINHFSSRDSTNSLKENNKIISPDYKNLYISTPLTTTRNNYYKSNRIISSHILNDNPLNNITNSLILNKLSKNRNYNNNLRIKSFNNNKTSYIFKMNNRYFSENLKIIILK